jgi:tRNA/rRNA methyltransferase/tRNA (cytidine32/uridine32-2'-O)-methyltransferase
LRGILGAVNKQSRALARQENHDGNG